MAPVLLNLDSIYSVSPQHRLSLTQSLKKASDPKDQSCREVKIGAKMVENWETQASAGKSPTVHLEKEEERPTSHVWGQEGWGGQRPRADRTEYPYMFWVTGVIWWT